jgi:protein PsiE
MTTQEESGDTVESSKPKSPMQERLHAHVDPIGAFLVDVFHYLGLFAIGGVIVWSGAQAFMAMADTGKATIHDVLLLFIYLELGAMVGIYFKTNHMPVRFLIYVAITALTRLLIEYIQSHGEPGTGIMYISGAILLLALSTLVIRYGSFKFPSGQGDSKG